MNIYVGLPLVVLLAEKYPVIAFDISDSRIAELKTGVDSTLEVLEKEKIINPNITYTPDPASL